MDEVSHTHSGGVLVPMMRRTFHSLQVPAPPCVCVYTYASSRRKYNILLMNGIYHVATRKDKYCLLSVFCSEDIEILTDEITLPSDRPRCGFYNELCPQDNSGNDYSSLPPSCFPLCCFNDHVRAFALINEEALRGDANTARWL